MFEEGVLPWIKGLAGRGAILTKTIRTVGVPESTVDRRIGHLMGKGNPDVGTGARDGMVDVRITARGQSLASARRILKKTEAEIRKLLGDAIYAVGEDAFETACARLLLQKKKTLAVAESATGGLISSRLISFPGVSRVLLGGVVAYSNAAKVRYLGVAPDLIRRYGAVSAEVARAMAEGVRKNSGAHFGLATTGIAGPTGGTKKKPVGLFFIAICSEDGTEVNEYHFRGNREQIRNRAAITALNLLWRRLK
jgi:nicotinamide-nucleotide amidase